MNSETAASNTSPLIFLEKINSIQLLGECFTNIIIPESVYKEWTNRSLPPFIKVESLSESSKSYVEGAVGRLHRGEIETVRLAVDKGLKYVLLDDLLARRYAQRHGLTPIGILGIMKTAYHNDVIPWPQLKNNIYELISKHNLFITEEILNKYWNSFK